MKLKHILVLLVLVLIAGCGGESNDTVKSAPVEMPVAPAAPEPVSEHKLVAPEEPKLEEGADVTGDKLEEKEEYNIPIDLSDESEVFTQVSCEDMVISVVVKNTGDETWILQRVPGGPWTNVGFMNRGVADATPGCEKDSIEPGESTVCSTIDMVVIEGENRVSVSSQEGSFAKLVMC